LAPTLPQDPGTQGPGLSTFRPQISRLQISKLRPGFFHRATA
jgi:hypothetical protein